MARESKSSVTIRRRRRRVLPDGDLPNALRHKCYHNDDNNLGSDQEDCDAPTENVIPASPMLRLLLSSDITLLLALLAYRALNALTIQTQFQPDEYWQSVEVAHNMAFGYGFLTWEWREGIRSYLYPSIFAALFKTLEVLHLDYRILMVKLPNLLQACCSAIGDLYLYKWSKKLSGEAVAQWTLLCQLTSWFSFYCSTRTLSNSMETVLTTVALYHFPWPHCRRKAQWKYVTLVGLAVVIRPTAAILWMPMCLWQLWMNRHSPWKILKNFAEKGLLVLAVSSLLDRIFYGHWVNVHYNFFKFNFLSGQSEFYGSHPWHWYLTVGVPILLGPHLFIFMLGIRRSMNAVVVTLIFWTTFFYSLLAHKDFRFLYPILPLTMHVCGGFLNHCTEEDETEEEESDDKQINSNEQQSDTEEKINDHLAAAKKNKISVRKRLVVYLLVILNIPLALYFGLIHQRGPVDVSNFLYEDTKHQHNETMKVLFLMSGHSTPYYSHLHKNISMEMLLCYPPSVLLPGEQCEAELFYNDPLNWIEKNLTGLYDHMPTHLVMYSVLHPTLSGYFEEYNYQECARIFHTHLPDGPRMGTHFIIMCKRSWIKEKNEHKRAKELKEYLNSI